MDEVEKADVREEEEVLEAELVEPGDPVDSEASAGALADLAGGGAEASASALDAMAAGLQAAPPDAIAAAEAKEQAADAEDALASLASGEVVVDDDEEPAEADAEVDDELEAPEFDFAEGEGIHVEPERLKAVREQQRVQRRKWRQQRQQHADRTDSLSFKKTMIPLLLAVGVLLLLISVVTAAMTIGKDVSAENRTVLQNYAVPLIVASLVIGLILIGGAVMFHLEIRRIQERQSPSPEPTERDE